ncbi:hypothetical protein Tco_0083689 [Tanacetum coccineum]
MADTKLKSFLVPKVLLPRHIFNILNQTSNAKEIWDNVELLMQGSVVSKKQFSTPNNQAPNFPSNSKTHATVHDGQIVTEPIQRKAPVDDKLGQKATAAFGAFIPTSGHYASSHDWLETCFVVVSA